MLAVLERTLADYRVSTARDATEAMAILSAPERVDLLITDYLMPGMTGEELTHHARATRIGLQVLVITGHAHAVEHAEPEWWGTEAHLIKPFRILALREAAGSLALALALPAACYAVIAAFGWYARKPAAA